MILGQESRKRIKEDKERRKVGIGRLGEEEGGLEVLVSKKIFRVRILKKKIISKSWCPDHSPVWIIVGGRTIGRLVEVLSKFGLSAAGILL